MLASRLSKHLPHYTILVIERGVHGDQRVEPALGFAPGFGSTIETNLYSVPQAGFEGISVCQTSGSILGGSSAINYETWTRGSSVDLYVAFRSAVPIIRANRNTCQCAVG